MNCTSNRKLHVILFLFSFAPYTTTQQIGDQVVLKAAEGPCTGCFLLGDAAAFNLGVQEPGVGHTKRDALNYDEYAFRVVPMLR